MSGLANRWRPRTFKDVVGQDHVTTILQRAAERGRIAPTYLLEGSRGTGKTSTARILAQVARCNQPTSGKLCGACAACRQETESAGYVELDAASNRNVEDTRGLRTAIEEGVTTQDRQSYIVDEVHMLTTAARDVLQETIENQPAGTTIILCTTEGHELGPDLKGRCQQHRFRRLNNRQIAEHLLAICRAEGHEAEPNSMMLIAHAADGGMRDAIQMLEHSLAVQDGIVTAEAINNILGTHLRQTVLSMTRHMLAGNETPAITALRTGHREGAEPRRIHREAADRLGDALAEAWNHERADNLPQTVRAAISGANWRRSAHVLWEWAEHRPPADATDTGLLEKAISRICEDEQGG